MEHESGYSITSATFWKLVRHLWKSPRGTVIRIDALAMVAIVLSLFLAAFGSCRRSSNRFIVQKGILAARALSVSLGIYCIGLMQSSRVKSEMYPIWAVSLLTLFASIDSITGYNLDYSSQLLNFVYQLCLYAGYVLLIGVSTRSSDVSRIALGILCAVTFIKGFHRSLSCVLLSRLRNVNKLIADYMERLDSNWKIGYQKDVMRKYPYVVEWPLVVKPKSDHLNNTTEHIMDIGGYQGNSRGPQIPPTGCHTIELGDVEQEAIRGKEDVEEEKEEGEVEEVEKRKEEKKEEQEVTEEEEEDDDEEEDLDMDIFYSSPSPPLVHDYVITLDKIWYCNINSPGSYVISYKDTCLSFALSHLLLHRFFGFNSVQHTSRDSNRTIVDVLLKEHKANGFERAFKVIEVELGFLYDLFFTNNAFLHFYEKKAATFWNFASITAIFFFGVATVIPTTSTSNKSGGTTVVKTTTCDIIISKAILVSIVLLHVLQLIRCWTSNWARVAFMCSSVRKSSSSWRVRLQEFLCRINWFDSHLWQNKLGQHSIIETVKTREIMLFKHLKCPFTACATLSKVFGFQYIEQVFQELFGSHTGKPTEISTDVKAAIVHHLIHSYVQLVPPFAAFRQRSFFGVFLQKCRGLGRVLQSEGRAHPIRTILIWHITTCYLEMNLCQKNRLDGNSAEGKELKGYIDVATKLSKYLVYLIVSAPQLLPEPTSVTKLAYDAVVRDARLHLHGAKDKYKRMSGLQRIVDNQSGDECSPNNSGDDRVFLRGVSLGQLLVEVEEDVTVRWRFVAEFWTTMLFHVTPSDNVKEHIERLARGGEFITHLWALLFHAGHSKWGSHGYFSEDCDQGAALMGLGQRSSTGSRNSSTDSDGEDCDQSGVLAPGLDVEEHDVEKYNACGL